MKKMYTLFVLLAFVAQQEVTSQEVAKQETLKTAQATTASGDNSELLEIYKNDQDDRKPDVVDWDVVSKKDAYRRKKVKELIALGKVKTSKDYARAAMIFQHGGDSTSYGMALKLMEKSIELDPTADKWLLAAATDRYLLSKGMPQIYGTQYFRNEGEPWKMGEIDTTKITDQQRIEYGVETLAQQKATLRRMNKNEGF